MMLIKHKTRREDYTKDTLFRKLNGSRSGFTQVLSINADDSTRNRNHVIVLLELWEWRVRMYEFLHVIEEALHDIYPDFLRSAYYGD